MPDEQTLSPASADSQTATSEVEDEQDLTPASPDTQTLTPEE